MKNSWILLVILFCCIQTTLATVKHRKIVKEYNVSSSVTRALGSQIFDFTYFGDVSHIPELLHQYDSQLVILPSLGSKKPINVNVDLHGISLNDVNDAINSQTNNQVNLIYDPILDSIRISFSSILDVGRDAVHESLKWQKGGSPKPILQADGVVRFPYGEYQPVVICQPLNLCDIELQAGEDIQGIVIGDSLRWNEGDQGIPVVYSGGSGNLIPHLVLKPTQGGLDTTLIVTTSKRTYMFKLKSAENGYVARVGFYYPSEMVEKFQNNKTKLQDQRNTSGTIATNPDIQMPLVNLGNVNYGYIVDGDNYPWKPTQIFDDGISVYIQMPLEVSSRSLPGLCVMVDGASSSDKRCEMVNFRYNDHFYIVDKLFDRAKLVNGFGDNMEVITIKRKPKPGFWARVFGKHDG